MVDRQPRFPDGFEWGTATAAHQTEGANWNNDWWAWEHDPGSPCVEPSGDACDHWHRFPDDIRLLAGLGFTTYRFSVEWSRIEPEDGELSLVALDHYRRMCATCLEHGLAPVVTLHHFTSPRWVAAAGGWAEPATAERFGRFAEVVAGAVGDLAHRFCTINEPNIVVHQGYVTGTFPPGERDAGRRRRADDVMVAGHRRAVEAVREAAPGVPVGLTLGMADHHAVGGQAAEERRARILADDEDVYLDAARDDDFIGVQTYTRVRIGPEGDVGPEEGVETTLMGYEFWPEALEATVRRAWKETGNTPVLVTENGIATDDDTRRVEYVQRAVQGVARCLDDGVGVLGYTYWSALDNFEWALGYRPAFGLVAVDRVTQERTVKPSARWLGACARANQLLPVASGQ